MPPADKNINTPMPLTLLLDLDDTLLINPMKPFMEGYLSLLSQHLENYVSADLMINRLIKATDKMVDKVHTYQTLEMVFDADFYPPLGLQAQELRSTIYHFYTDIFPALKEITTPRPEAIKAVKHAFSFGYRVVIATNPLFPAIATSQRLEWAGLPASEYPFDLVTSYESMHFAKPNSAYFAEILAQLGWPPEQPVCMAGNYYKHDILPLQCLGIPGYLIENGHDSEQNTSIEGISAGPLENLIPWMDSIASQVSPPAYNQPDAILSILRSTPGALATLTRRLKQSDWDFAKNKESRNSSEIVSQLNTYERLNSEVFSNLWQERHGEDQEEQIYLLCQDEIQNSAEYPNQTLIDFYYRRSILINNLDDLPRELWNEIIDHPLFGRKTIFDCLNQLAANDRHLLHQIKTTIDLL